MATVLVTDYTFPDLDLERSLLEADGCRLVSGQYKTIEALLPVVADVDCVITQFAPIREEVVRAMTKARAIVRYGIGVDNVALDAARDKGIAVCNVPDYCIDEVADHTLAFILGCTRQVMANALHVRARDWGLAVPLERMRILCDLTVGCVGFGRIGREVLRRLEPFGCRRLVHDPFVGEDTILESGCEAVSFEELLVSSDVLTLHCPSTSETRHLVDASALAKMRAGSILVNVGRGDLVEPTALVEAVRSGHLAAVALDVFEPEPIPEDCPLRTLPNVLVSSHIASASVKASRQLRETAAKLALAAVRGEPLANIVNGVSS